MTGKYFLSFLIIYLFQLTTAAQLPRLMVRSSHSDDILSAGISPDQKKFITSSRDKTAKLWDASGKLLLNLPHKEWVKSAAFSEDGASILTTDGSVHIWDSKTGREHKRFDIFRYSVNYTDNGSGREIETDFGFFSNVNETQQILDSLTRLKSARRITGLIQPSGSLSFTRLSKDGSNFLTSCFDSLVQIWNVVTGKIIRSFKTNQKQISALEYSQDNTKILAAFVDSSFCIWDAASGEIVKKINSPDAVLLAIFHPDNKTVLTCGRKILRWDISTGKIVKTYDAPESASSISLLLNGEEVAITSSFVRGTTVINLQTGVYRKIGNTTATYISSSRDGKKIILGHKNGTCSYWDARSGEPLLSLEGPSQTVRCIAFSLDGNYIFTSATDNDGRLDARYYARIWNTKSGQPLSNIKNDEDIIQARFNRDGTKLLTVSQTNGYFDIESGGVKLWDVNTGKLIREFPLKRNVGKAVFSPDEKYILCSADSAAVLFDSETGTTVRIFNPNKGLIKSMDLSPDGKLLLTTFSDRMSRLWDISSGRAIRQWPNPQAKPAAIFSPDLQRVLTFNLDSLMKPDSLAILTDLKSGEWLSKMIHPGIIASALFSPDGKYIVTEDVRGLIWVWDEKGKLLWKLEGNRPVVSPDGKRLAAVYNPSGFGDKETMAEIREWDLRSGKLIRALNYNHRLISVYFAQDGSKIASLGADNSVSIWLTGKTEPIYSFYSIDSVNYHIQVPDGFYTATPAVARQFYYITPRLEVITFDQLDVKFNRPDKVLSAIGSNDTSLIKSYRLAWYKRLRKLGADSSYSFDYSKMPVLDILNRNMIEFEQQKDQLSLHVTAHDSIGTLSRLHVRINEVPYWGMKGLNIVHHKISFDTIITVPLSYGMNEIEVSVTNSQGMESYRIPLVVKYQPAVKPKENTWFIGIGIDEFADSRYNLSYSSEDIRSLTRSLRSKYGSSLRVDTLLNKNVTIENIKKLKELLKKTGINDRVIISYSGHGLLSKSYDYFLSTYTTNFQNPESGGMPYEDLEYLLDGIPARKKLLLIDACHSGEIDKEEFARLTKSIDSLGLSKGRGVIVESKNSQTLGLNNSYALMQNLFVNVTKSTGTTVISAAAGTQLALERNDLKKGVFTYSVIEALTRYRSIKVSEFRQEIIKRVNQLTRGIQVPTSRMEMLRNDWEL